MKQLNFNIEGLSWLQSWIIQENIHKISNSSKIDFSKIYESYITCLPKDRATWTEKVQQLIPNYLTNINFYKHINIQDNTGTYIFQGIYQKKQCLFVFVIYSHALAYISLIGILNDNLLKKIQSKLIPSQNETNINQIEYRISFRSGMGVSNRRGVCIADSWEDINSNYHPETSARLVKLINNPSVNDGKLIIFYGPPGTGKTYAIKTLLLNWKSSVEGCFIVDPDVFLDDPQYYFSLYSGKPSLIILEDSANSISKLSRSSMSSRMSKLLNLSDGMLAQGQNDQFLISFNEDVEEVDEAVIRVGRCRDIVEFKKLEIPHIQSWCDHNKIDYKPKDSMSLAELYHVKRHGGDSVETPKRKQLGFHNA